MKNKMVKRSGIPRPEYPRPQFAREEWLNLNGIWYFEFDDEDCGIKAHWESEVHNFSREITVPFAYQTKLSGINKKELHDIVWYKREFKIPKAWNNKRILMHFGAVDYSCKVWINGKLVVCHEGGHTPFEADISEYLDVNNVIVVRVQDYSKDVSLPRGKQYWKSESKYIFYTGTTGIWQTVWLEPVNDIRLEKIKFTPDIDNNQINIGLLTVGNKAKKELSVCVEIYFTGSDIEQSYVRLPVVTDTYRIFDDWEYRSIGLANFNLEGFERWWSPERPNLYEVTFTVFEGNAIIDKVESYFGMRKIAAENGVIYFNNKPYKQRLVLDQGYFPQGGLTAPTDEDIKNDICLAKKMGFNGARKHQKIEDPRWLYWCDHLGYLVWEEMSNAYTYTNAYAEKIMKEWVDIINRDYNHPSIVVWMPINESWGVPNINLDKFQQNHVRAMYYLTKSLDDTRLVQSNDGWEHISSDICTIHDYESDKDVLTERYSDIRNILDFMPAGRNLYAGNFTFTGEPIMVTEFGGIAYEQNEKGWGYSSASTKEDFIERLKAVFIPLQSSKNISGFCYTQLTDVEQEMNGLLTYDRSEKIPIDVIRKVVEGN